MTESMNIEMLLQRIADATEQSARTEQKLSDMIIRHDESFKDHKINVTKNFEEIERDLQQHDHSIRDRISQLDEKQENRFNWLNKDTNKILIGIALLLSAVGGIEAAIELFK